MESPSSHMIQDAVIRGSSYPRQKTSAQKTAAPPTAAQNTQVSASAEKTTLRRWLSWSVFGIRIAVVIAVVYWIAIAVGTHLPGGLDFTHQIGDKWKHFGAFAGLSFLCCVVADTWRHPFRYVYVILTITCYAALDEWTQRFVPRRVPDFADWFADFAGALAGAAVVILVAWAIRARRSRVLPRFAK